MVRIKKNYTKYRSLKNSLKNTKLYEIYIYILLAFKGLLTFPYGFGNAVQKLKCFFMFIIQSYQKFALLSPEQVRI